VFAPGGVPATIDRNGKYLVEAMYVQYLLPVDRRGVVPLLMWHGGGLTGVTYETKPDGGEGWLTWFLKKGWDVYNSDAVERGVTTRSTSSCSVQRRSNPQLSRLA
jgi:hypothetical protein